MSSLDCLSVDRLLAVEHFNTLITTHTFDSSSPEICCTGEFVLRLCSCILASC